jgi:hypothetical protein
MVLTSHGTRLSTVSRAHAVGWSLLATLLLAAACGGGGGGGGGGGTSPTPTPAPGSTATPRPTTTAAPTPSPSPSPDGNARARIILAENDTIGDVEVVDVEDASLNDAGAVAAIVTARGASGGRALLLGGNDGGFSALVTPDGLPGGDTKTLSRVRLAETGAAIFEAGDGLDSDRLYFASDGVVQALAGAAPGVTSPTFRILGDVVIGGNGLVGFVGGGDECKTDTTDENPRLECAGHLFVAQDGSVSEVEAEGLELAKISPTRPQVAVADTGVAFFSAPASGEGPVILRWDDGKVSTVLARNAELEGVGRLVSPQVAAANADEQLLLTTTFAKDATPRPTVLGILEGKTFTTLDTEGTAVGDQVITDLRAVGLDEQGRALYIVRIGAEGATDAPRTLRLKDAHTSVDVATEKSTLPGSDKTLLSIQSQRLNRRGDVAFIAELGRIDGLTTIIEEVRLVVRLADGRYVTSVSSANPQDLGTLSDFEIAGFDDNANALLIATRNPNQTVLVFAPLPTS